MAAGHAGLQHEWPASDWLAVVGCRVDVGFTLQQVCGHNVHVLPRPEEWREGPREFHLYRIVVDHLEVLDRIEAAARADRDLGIYDGLVGELDILAGEGLSVAPLHISLEGDLPFEAVWGDTAIAAGWHL